VKVWLAGGVTDMRRGMNGLTLQIQEGLGRDPHAGDLFVFRGRRGDLLKIIWWDAQGACLFSKRLERGRFVWPAAKEGKICLSASQMTMLLEGIDWRMPQKTWRPLQTGWSIKQGFWRVFCSVTAAVPVYSSHAGEPEIPVG